MKFIMKNRIFTLFRIILVILSVLTLTGCGRKTSDPATYDTEETEGENPAPFSHAVPWEPSADIDYVFPKTAPFIDDTGKSIQRDGNFLYSYYGGRLIRFDQETEETVLLYQTASTHALSFCLYENDIYFVERTGYDSLDDRDTSLWRMGKDGKDLTLLQGDIVNAGTVRFGDDYSIDIYDDILYLINYTSGYENGDYITKTANLYYRLEHDGSVSEVDESETLYGTLPRRFSPVFDKNFPTFPYAMRNYGYLFMQDSNKVLYRMEPVSGKRESFMICAADYFAFSGNLVFLYSYNMNIATLLNLDDKTTIQLEDTLFDPLYNLTVSASDQGFYLCYDLPEEDFSGETLYRFHILRLLPDGSVDTLAVDSPRSYDDSYSVQIRNNNCISGNHLYYYENDETFYRLMRRSLEENADPRKIESFPCYPASSPVSVHAEEKDEETQIEGGSSVSFSLRKLFLEEQTEADRAINRTLTDVYTDFESYVEDLIREEQEALKEDPDFYEGFDYISGNDLSLYTHLDYMDDETISFCCYHYQYYAYAAHGYYWSDYYVFDRQTGERLSFEDFVGNSAAIVNTATPYVEKMAGWDFDSEMLLDISRFSLSEDGYTLYFAPYDIDCYAAGSFLITIPYEAFEKEL